MKYRIQLTRPLITALLAFTVTACSSSSIENPVVQPADATNEQNTTTGNTAVTDTSPTLIEQYRLEITLSGDLLDGIVGSGNALFTVWGYDNYVADVAATTILDTSLPIKSLSESYEVLFTSSDLATTEYQSGAPGALGYYLKVYVDVNADGLICNGDYRQNYEISEMEFYNQSDYRIQREIAVTLITNRSC